MGSRKLVNVEHMRGSVGCECSICWRESKYRVRTYSKTLRGESKGFTWMIETIGKAALKHSFVLNIADTVVFRHGKPAFSVHQSKEKFLKFTNNPEKLKHQEVMKNFNNKVRIRKREENQPRNSNLSGDESTSTKKDVAVVRLMNKGSDNDKSEITPQDEEGSLRVMNENDITSLMWERASSHFWKTICYMQTVLKVSKGIGESFVYDYVTKNKSEDLNYEELKEAALQEKSEFTNRLLGCELVCKKIAYYVALASRLEILRMRVEFLEDEDKELWVIHSTRIQVRKTQLPYIEEPKPKIVIRNTKSKRELLKEYIQAMQTTKTLRSEKISEAMLKKYEEVKHQTGFDELFKETERDNRNDEAFAKLRPNARYTLNQLLEERNPQELLAKHLNPGSTNSKSRKNTFYSTYHKSFTPKRLFQKSDKKYLPKRIKLIESEQTSFDQSRWTYTPKIRKRKLQNSTPQKLMLRTTNI